MKIIKILCVLLASSAFSAKPARAITADELAAYLGISSWHTTVDLPPDSFSIQLYKFADGEIKGIDLISLTDFAKHPETGLTVMQGKQDGKYRFVLIGCTGSYGVPTAEATFTYTNSPPLPEKIGEGDFILLGMPLAGESLQRPNDLRSYAKGFLLRIKKRN